MILQVGRMLGYPSWPVEKDRGIDGSPKLASCHPGDKTANIAKKRKGMFFGEFLGPYEICGDLFLWVIFAITFYLIVLYHDVFSLFGTSNLKSVGSESSRISRWLFHFFYVHPYLGKWSNLTNTFIYFSDGLKPPTRHDLRHELLTLTTGGCFFSPVQSTFVLVWVFDERTKACYTTTLNPNIGLLVAWGSPKKTCEQSQKKGM